MINKTVQVKSATTEQGKGNKTYLSVVLTDGKRENKYAIFDPALQTTLQNAYKSGENVNVGLEKEGNFWNVKSAEITSENIQTTEREPVKQTKTWKPAKDQDAEDWTNIRTAVMQATLLRTHLVPGAKTEVGAMMQDAAEIFAGMCVMKPDRGEK